MSTTVVAHAELGSLIYQDFTHTWATAEANGTADSIGDVTQSLSRCRIDRDTSPAKIMLFQWCALFDLAAVPKNARIISGSLQIVTAGSASTTGSPSSTDFRIVGPGDANDPIELDDFRAYTDAPAALTADIAYNDASPDVALTATGVQHVQNWFDSDDKVKFTTLSVAGLNGDDPYNDNFQVIAYEWETSTLTLTYEEPAAAMLGCNF